MIAIILSLLGGWILNLFGFDTLLIAGMSQLFGVTMTSAGYYTIFGLLGMARSVASRTRSPISVSDYAKDFKRDRDKARKAKKGE